MLDDYIIVLSIIVVDNPAISRQEDGSLNNWLGRLNVNSSLFCVIDDDDDDD